MHDCPLRFTVAQVRLIFLLGLVLGIGPTTPCPAGEVLYNGIELPDAWPPDDGPPTREPMRVPYLEHPPDVISIDVGRQLFVDDFLIEQTDLKRTFHQPTWHAGNPVLKADQPFELETNVPGAAPFSDGAFYDPADKLFKLWYLAPCFRNTCYAVSRDGIHWEKPALDVIPGTNIALPPAPGVTNRFRDSCTVWLDHHATDPARRFLMFIMSIETGSYRLTLRYSPDGIHWADPAAVSAKPISDRTTVFHNPFRNKWVVSQRINYPDVARARAYLEGDDPVVLVNNAPNGAVPWTSADRLDPHNPNPEFSDIPPQLYNLDAAPYESLMLGLFSVWQGPTNKECAKRGIHKRNEILIGFSRDGFHWDRPDRTPFLGVNETKGAWNWGNVQSVGGGCLVVGDKLYFYASGRALSDKLWDADMSTGLATMRRDGFASMDAENRGVLTTRPIRFTGKHLFVNVDAAHGELTAEILDESGKVIQPFTAENCIPVDADSTIAHVTWRNAGDLSALAGRPVRVRFHLDRARLFSFWVSPNASGASQGFVAAGGPGFTDSRDTVGQAAYRAAGKTEP